MINDPTMEERAAQDVLHEALRKLEGARDYVLKEKKFSIETYAAHKLEDKIGATIDLVLIALRGLGWNPDEDDGADPREEALTDAERNPGLCGPRDR